MVTDLWLVQRSDIRNIGTMNIKNHNFGRLFPSASPKNDHVPMSESDARSSMLVSDGLRPNIHHIRELEDLHVLYITAVLVE